MPCTLREKDLSYRSRRDKGRETDVLAPKPVHPRAIRGHGLFGMSFVRQHQVADERWTPNSLTEQFKGMTNLLNRRIVFKYHEAKTNRLRYSREHKRLKIQCRDGRTKLQKIIVGDNTHKLRNFLINHKDMQRLYQKMPIHLVVDNINQRTFVMRKERDRLEFRLNNLKREYKNLLLTRALVENRIIYENEFVLDEEIKSRIYLKKIENSNVRLKAIKTINNTYRKMIQVLIHDEIFYDPILRSLSADMDDQSNFIKHILYLGMPAIAKFKELNEEYRQLENKVRKNVQLKLQLMASLKPPETPNQKAKQNEGIESVEKSLRYVRQTPSMMALKWHLENIEKTIKEVKFITLCSQAREIYPRMKAQVENNDSLQRIIENHMLAHEMLETKMKCASVLQGVLINNLSEEEINRQERIKDLRKILQKDETFEEQSLQHIKNRADVYVMLRITLWNLVEILRHVDRQPKMVRTNYTNSYLKLPLLRFEMLNMRAAAPEIFEENIDNVMHSVKRKLYKLMKSHKTEQDNVMKRHLNNYRTAVHERMHTEELVDKDEQTATVPQEDVLQENKTMANVPNRKQIKAQSAKLVEELSKRED